MFDFLFKLFNIFYFIKVIFYFIKVIFFSLTELFTWRHRVVAITDTENRSTLVLLQLPVVILLDRQ